MTKEKLIVSMRLAIPDGTDPPNHLIVCAFPLMLTAFGIYGVAPCSNIIDIEITYGLAVGTLVNAAVKFWLIPVT